MASSISNISIIRIARQATPFIAVFLVALLIITFVPEIIGVVYFSITDDILTALPACKAIIRYGIGYDAVDVKAASRRSVAVCNLPRYCICDVATHAMALPADLKTIVDGAAVEKIFAPEASRGSGRSSLRRFSGQARKNVAFPRVPMRCSWDFFGLRSFAKTYVKILGDQPHRIPTVMGAKGTLAPMVNTAAEAKRLVRYTKYAPLGARGISTMRAHTDYNPPPLMEYIEKANKETLKGLDSEKFSKKI